MMISGAIPMLFSPEHRLHAPAGEFEQGKIIDNRDTPERIDILYRHLVNRSLGLTVSANRVASIDDLFSIHAFEMLDFMEATSQAMVTASTESDRYLYAEFFPIRGPVASRPKSQAARMGLYCTDTYSPIGPGTWKAATASAGLAIQGAELILRHEASYAYALCRPPGHHAGPDFFGSYCYLNNAALAARRLLSLGRVAILDIDYHHGNGTQAIFWDEPRVLYASLHIDPNFDFPYFTGFAHETGGTQAPGSTFNIPLPPGTPTASYLAALDALLNSIHAFRPAALVVSLGFDPFQGDPLSAFRIEAGAYNAIGGRIGALNLPTLLVQEGGYAVEFIGALAENFLTGFLSSQLAP